MQVPVCLGMCMSLDKGDYPENVQIVCLYPENVQIVCLCHNK